MAVVLHSRGISCFWSEVFFAFDFVIGESFEVRLERECRVSLMISQLMIYQRDDTLLISVLPPQPSTRFRNTPLGLSPWRGFIYLSSSVSTLGSCCSGSMMPFSCASPSHLFIPSKYAFASFRSAISLMSLRECSRLMLHRPF